jgi:hypothetical protein
MLKKNKQKLFENDIKIYEIKWYPCGQITASSGRNAGMMTHMPPLMVRKAQWRR